MPRYDDDEDDDRPRRRRRRDDDDEHDPFRPRKKRGGGPPIGLIVGGGVAVVLLLVGGIVLALTMKKDGPQAAKVDPPPAPAARPEPAPLPDGGPNPFPPENRPDNQNPGVAPKQPKVGTAMPVGIPSVNHLIFGGGEDGVVGLIGYNLTGGGETLTVAKTKTGERVGTVQIDTKDGNHGYALAPGGRFVAVRGSEPFNGDPVVLFDVPSGHSTRFTPYKRSPATITEPNLVAVAFTGPDRLVTFNERSGFDVWQLPGLKRLGGQAARPKNQFVPLGTAGVGWNPKNYGASEDGRTIAVFDGTGFSFFDGTTAEPRAKTEAACKENQSMNFWAAAFSADGKRFACLMSQFQGREGAALVVWDAASGKRVSAAALAPNETAPGLGWWGSNHVAVWQGGLGAAKVFDVQTGRPVADVKTDGRSGRQIIAAWTPADKLWYSFDGPGFRATGAAPVIQSIPAPATLPGRTLTLTPDGPRWD
ncbi:MAG: hypothetical protein U0804_16815 [Gemmataceae bacterium]